MEKRQYKYMWNYFLAALNFGGFWLSFLALVLSGFTWTGMASAICCGALGALSISAFRNGSFLHDQYLRQLAQTCQDEEEKSEKQLLQD